MPPAGSCAWYGVLVASRAPGVNVARLVAGSYDKDPATGVAGVPTDRTKLSEVSEDTSICSLNTTDTVVPGSTPVAPDVGIYEPVTGTGGTVSGGTLTVT